MFAIKSLKTMTINNDDNLYFIEKQTFTIILKITIALLQGTNIFNPTCPLFW